MNELIENLTQLSPPVALAVALYFVGAAIKKSPWSDWLIPFALPLLGAVLYPFIAETANVSYSVKNPTAFNAIIGVSIGGMSIALENMIYQWLNRGTTAAGGTPLLKKSESVVVKPETKP